VSSFPSLRVRGVVLTGWAGLAAIGLFDALPAGAQRKPYPVDVTEGVWIPMRDGVRLSTDLYRPRGVVERLPTILIRTPYDKSRYRPPAGQGPYYGRPSFFASMGYIVAVQNKRGRHRSEGVYQVGANDPLDSFDTIEWLTNQPWSNGRVGSYGCSYDGELQLRQMSHPHPRLAAMIVQAGGGGLGKAGGRFRHFSARDGGVLNLAMGFDWFAYTGTKVASAPPPEPLDSTATRAALWSLPVVRMMERLPAPPNDWVEIVSHGAGDPWWDQFGYLDGTEPISAPTLHVTSWFDTAPDESLLAFELFRRNAVDARVRSGQYAIVAPTLHCEYELAGAETTVGQLQVGDARFPYQQTYLAFFDRFLRDDSTAWGDPPRVRYYQTGANRWREADRWPPAGVVPTAFYLRSQGRANSAAGDGRLAPDPPEDEPPDAFTYDPADPTPSLGGPSCCLAPNSPMGPVDQRSVEQRADVLVYSSGRLAEPVDVAGPIRALLFISSDATDTDFTAKLVDVFPDGRALNLVEGILRTRYREGFDHEARLSPGEVYEIEVSLEALAHRFGTGHRIRLEVSSSNFPRFERNLNTGGRNFDESEWIVAHNQVHHGRRSRSRLILPILPATP